MRASPLEPDRSWPGTAAASRTWTLQPRRVRAQAAERPRSPAPTTTHRRWSGTSSILGTRGTGPRGRGTPAVRSAAVTSGMDVSSLPTHDASPGEPGQSDSVPQTDATDVGRRADDE